VLNVVNFGGGSYVLYAEVQGDEIEVDPEPYSDNFARPARLLPLEAKALVAAIDLLEPPARGSLASAPEDRAGAGRGPVAGRTSDRPSAADDPDLARTINRAIVESRMVSIGTTKENEDEVARAHDRAHALINGREGWYVFSFDPTVTTPPLPARPDQAAEVTRKTFEPRPEVDERRPRGLATAGAVPSSRVARCGSRPSARAGSASAGPWPRSWPTARWWSSFVRGCTGSCASSEGAGDAGGDRARRRPRRRARRPPTPSSKRKRAKAAA
jgi:proteasome accessory factor C